MPCLSRIRRLVALALVGGTMAGCALASNDAPANWRTWELGAFRMRAPANLVHVPGGVDSQAGVLTADGLRIEYDFGLYSDPLDRRDDMAHYHRRDGTVDGAAASIVQFRLIGIAAALPSCSGVHVPSVRRSSMGALSLTVLACGASADDLNNLPAIFRSIRFQGSAARS